MRERSPLHPRHPPPRRVDPASRAARRTPQASVEKRSPVCGSRVIVDVALDAKGRVAALGQEVKACALGQASAALMGAHAIGRSPAELAEARDALAAWLAGERDDPGDWPGLDSLGASPPPYRPPRRDPAAVRGGGGSGLAGRARGGPAMNGRRRAGARRLAAPRRRDPARLRARLRPALPPPRPRRHARLSGRRRARRPAAASGSSPRARHAACRRFRHRAAALPGRARAQPVATVADAARYFRLRPAPGGALRPGGLGPGLAGHRVRPSPRRWRSVCRSALSSTAQVLPLLQSAGRLSTPFGERAFSILLFQDLSIVPLITIIAAMCRNPADAGGPPGWLLGALHGRGGRRAGAGRALRAAAPVPPDRQYRRARDVHLRRPCSR